MNTLTTTTTKTKAEMDAELDTYFNVANQSTTVTTSVPIIVKKPTISTTFERNYDIDPRINYSGGGYGSKSDDYNRQSASSYLPSYSSSDSYYQPRLPIQPRFPIQSPTQYNPYSHNHHDSTFFSQVKYGNHSSKKIADIIVDKFRDRDHIICIDWMKNKKCELKDCPFLHDIHYTFKSLICLDWDKNNNCRFESNKCRFAHGNQDPFYKNNRAVEPRHQLLSRINRASEFTSYTSGRARSRSRERDVNRDHRY
jgi:hypothetical protein